MMVYPPHALGATVRLWSDELGLPHGEYIASVLAERFGHPYWAAPEVRTHEGGLRALLEAASPKLHSPADEDWDTRDVFVTKPVLALGELVRDEAKKRRLSLSKLITLVLAEFHGIDLDARTVTAPTFDEDPLGIGRNLRLREEVQRLLA